MKMSDEPDVTPMEPSITKPMSDAAVISACNVWPPKPDTGTVSVLAVQLRPSLEK